MRVIFIFAIVFLSKGIMANVNDVCLEVKMTVKSDRVSLSQVSVGLIKNGKHLSTLYTDEKGKIILEFTKDNQYELNFSKEGYYNQKITFDTKLYGNTDGYWNYKFLIELLPVVAGINADFFDQAAGEFIYNPETDEFSNQIDSKATESFRKFLKSYELERTSAFKNTVSKADSAFTSNNLELSKELYLHAALLNPYSDYIDVQLYMIEEIIKQDAHIQFLYDKNIARADAFNSQRDFKNAEKYYLKSLKYKDNKYPRQQLASIRSTISLKDIVAKY